MNGLRCLFQPIRIGPVLIQNRIASSAHTTVLGKNYRPSEKHLYYYSERAKGGIGLIVMEGVRVHPTSGTSPGSICCWNRDRDSIAEFARIADGVHQHGTKIFCQLLHMGRQMRSFPGGSNLPLWAPSPLPSPTNKEIPHPMSLAEIDEVIAGFGLATEIVKDAGFDGIEIHGAHGYLVQQFLSPWSNQRSDEYGGSFENRLRFAKRVIDVVRKKAGSQMALGLRISADEFTDGGLTLHDVIKVVKEICAMGKVDFLSVSHCNYDYLSFCTMIPDMHFPMGSFVYLASGIRKEAEELPILAVARIVDPVQADRIIQDGHADLVCMTRATICDPEMPKKAREGRLAEIRSCVGCNQGCIGFVHRGLPISCLQNPAVGKEKEWGIGTLISSQRRKRVLVIGGGPAGMKAASLACQRGHEVSLLEKKSILGGNVFVAAKVPCRIDFNNIISFLVSELARFNVQVELNTEVDAKVVSDMAPDAVVIATGAVPVLPFFDKDGSIPTITVEEYLLEGTELGENVVFLDEDGTFRASGAIEFIADQGKQVYVVTPYVSVGVEIVEGSWVGLQQRLGYLGVEKLCTSKVTAARNGIIQIADIYSGRTKNLENITSIVGAANRQPNDGLFDQLQGIVDEIYLIGDSLAPRSTLEAIKEGYRVGRQL